MEQPYNDNDRGVDATNSQLTATLASALASSQSRLASVLGTVAGARFHSAGFQPYRGLSEADKKAQALEFFRALLSPSEGPALQLAHKTDTARQAPPLPIGQEQLESHNSETTTPLDRPDLRSQNPASQPPDNSVAGLKLPIFCNDISGVLCMDQQIVACHCESCEQRVAAGYDRPIFSLTRYERHSGSKAKKWRLSLRIQPGAVPECPRGASPLPIGHWLSMRGLHNWGTNNANVSGVGNIEMAECDGAPKGARPPPSPISPQFLKRHATPTLTYQLPPMKRLREESPDGSEAQPSTEKRSWFDSQRAVMEAAAGADETEGGHMLRHAAIFQLVHGLMGTKAESSDLNQVYLPWLNDLQPSRLQSEFSTLKGYVDLSAIVGESAIEMAKDYLAAIIAKEKRINT